MRDNGHTANIVGEVVEGNNKVVISKDPHIIDVWSINQNLI